MSQRIPVFIISGKSPIGDSGGYPTYANSLSKTLTLLGFDVHTLAIREKAYVQKTEYGELHFLSTRLLLVFPFLRHLALAGLPYYSIIFTKEIKKIVRKKNITHFILWGMGPWAFPGVILRLFPIKDSKMNVISSYFTSTRHEMKGALDSIRMKDYGIMPKLRYFLVYEMVARIFHIFEKLTLDNCDAVIVHYNSSKQIIKKYFNVQEKKIYIFPWYTEIFKRKGAGGSEKKKYRHPLIVSICRQDPRKGLNFLIRAMEIVSSKFPKAQCLIVGDGSFLELNKKLVKQLRMEKYIHFTGFVPDIKPILREADIAVIVPLRQGSSALTVLEAMSYGKAIVGSDCDGIPEDIIHNTSGLIVERANEFALADALTKLIENPKLRAQFGNNAYTAYKKRFNFNRMKDETKNILEGVLKNGGSKTKDSYLLKPQKTKTGITRQNPNHQGKWRRKEVYKSGTTLQ